MAWYDIFKPYDDSYSKSQKQLDAEANYQKELDKAIAKNPNAAKNPTGAADVLKVLGGSSLADAGYDSTLKKAWDATQNFAVADDTYTTGGGYTKAEKSKRKAEAAAKKSIVTEVAEEEPVEEKAEVVEEKKEQPVNTPAVQSVLQDVEIGLKGGTIANEAAIPSQGISKDDKTGLRPRRSIRSMGMLASYQPGQSQSLLASS